MLYLFQSAKEAFQEFSQHLEGRENWETPNCVFYDHTIGHLKTMEDFQKISYPILTKYRCDYDATIPESFHVLTEDEIIKTHAKAYSEMNKCLFILDKIKK